MDLKDNGLKLTSNPQPDTIKLSRDPMSMEGMVVEYASTDMFGDYTFSPLVSSMIYLFMSIYDALIRTWLLLSSYIVYHNILYQHFGTNTSVCILYIWQCFSYWKSSCLYIDFCGTNLMKDDLCHVDKCTTNSILREVKCFHSRWEKGDILKSLDAMRYLLAQLESYLLSLWVLE